MPRCTDAPQCSRYLAQLLAARPEAARELDGDRAWPLAAQELRDWLAEPLDDESLKPALRRLKQRAFARIAARDLAGAARLEEVTEAMTTVAEVAIETALAVLARTAQARYGVPRNPQGEEQHLIVVGMGKLGGRELNVSSDIDLIFVYPEDGETDGARPISNFEYFTRLGRSLINAISDMTGEGRVFRVDMRLRPNGDSGPLVCSFDMLETYFVTQGREWERYAWIKARALSGGRDEELEAIRRPFVFRKYLDFGTIDALRDLHAQIRREVMKKDMADNVKLGPGGIREIEFIAQVFQLIRGGRDRALQIKPTLQVLDLLVERGQLQADAVADLKAAYQFLRRLEHRLQYLDDAQTHSLPANPDDRATVARGMGYASYDALLAELDDHRQSVSQHFEAIFSAPARRDHALDPVWHGADGAGDGLAAELSRLGFKDVAAACERLAGIRSGTRYQQLPENVKSRFDALVPRAIEAAAATADADATLARCLDLFEAVSRRAAYLSLLLEYPQALEKLAQIAGSSSWAAGYLLRHPILLDELLSASILESLPDWAAFRRELEARLEDADPDVERQMDLMREAHHAQVFHLLMQDLAGVLPLERLSDYLSELADLMLELTIKYAWRQLARRHIETPRFAVISYGKLGGKELGYASDLDMIFLFDDDHPDAAQIYSKLAMRINTWLSSQTSAGLLFETDLRLRPNGEAGLVVTSLAAFRQYQLENAWVWEHQALTRARFSAGDAAIGKAFQDIRVEILQKKRDLADLKREVLQMRQKMYDAHAGKSGLFDLKHDAGGLIDVEFIVQALVLGHAHDHPELAANRGNIALLAFAADAELIPRELAYAVRDAYREYRRMQHALRLNSTPGRVEPALVADKAAAVRALWDYVFGNQS